MEADSGTQGCNSIDTFVPEAAEEPGLSHVWSFETCLNLQCSGIEVALELGPVLQPVLRPKFKMSIELHPSSPRAAISSPI